MENQTQITEYGALQERNQNGTYVLIQFRELREPLNVARWNDKRERWELLQGHAPGFMGDLPEMAGSPPPPKGYVMRKDRNRKLAQVVPINRGPTELHTG